MLCYSDDNNGKSLSLIRLRVATVRSSTTSSTDSPTYRSYRMKNRHRTDIEISYLIGVSVDAVAVI